MSTLFAVVISFVALIGLPAFTIWIVVGDAQRDITKFLDSRNDRKIRLLQAKAQLEKAKKQ